MSIRSVRLAVLVLAFTAPLEAQEIEIRGRLSAAAEIVLVPAEDTAVPGPETAAVRVRTGEDGSFRLVAPGPGMWRLKVAPAAGVPLVNRLLPLFERRFLGEIEVPKVRQQSVRVRDGDGTGVAGLRLVAWGTSRLPPEMRGAGWSLDDRTAVTDNEGRAVFPRAEAEHLHVAGAAEGHYVHAEIAPHEMAPAELVRRPLTEARVVDAEGRPVAGIRGLFRPTYGAFGPSGAAGEILIADVAELVFADAEGTLESELRRTGDVLVIHLKNARKAAGRVVDAATGDAIAGALVWTEGAHTEADGHGAFVLRLGAAGLVHAVANGYLPAWWGGRSRGSGPWDPFDGELTIALHPATTLAGTVVDPNGQGLSGASVRADIHSGRRASRPDHMRLRMARTRPHSIETDTDREGRWELRGVPRVGSYRLLARRSGFASAAVNGELTGPGAEPVRIVLEPALEASGTVVDIDRHPIARAQVTLTDTGPRGLSSKTESDEEGHFVITDLAPGTHRLSAWAEGFSDAVLPGIEISRDAEADLGTVVLQPALVLRGRVVDAEGRSLVGANVMIFGGSYRGFGESTATREGGAFEVGNLPRGETLMLHASHEGYQGAHMEFVLTEDTEPLEVVMKGGCILRGRVVDAARRPALGVTVTVERRRGGVSSSRGLSADEEGRFTFSGEAPGPVWVRAASQWGFAEPVEAVLETGRVREIEIILEPGATLEGQVLDADENGVADVDIVLEEVRAGADGGAPMRFHFQRNGSVSDGAGRFTLKGLALGTYRLRAQHPDFEEVTEVVELESAAVRQVRIHLGPRLEPLSIRGRVVDGTGRGVGDARVGLEDSRDWYVGDRSSPDGSFHLHVPGPGIYKLVANHVHLVPSPVTEVEVTAGEIDGVVLELAAGSVVHGRFLGLEREDLGRVAVQANGAEGRWHRAGRVGPDATYAIRGLAAGEWTVVARLGGHRVRETVTVAGAGDEVLLDLAFPEGHRLRGVVLLDGQPLSGARVSPSCGAFPFSSPQTGLDGSFAVEEVSPGPCDVRVQVPGSPALRARRELEIAGDKEVVLEIESASMDGTVADEVTGTPLAGVEIALLPDGDEHNRAVESTRSDAVGRFAFPRLAAGSWRIRAEAEGYGAAVEAVTVSGAVSVAEIRLRPTPPLVLEIRTSSGGVPAYVTLELAGNEEAASAGLLLPRQAYQLDRESRLVLGSVPSGRYRLRVFGPMGNKAEVEVEHPGTDIVRVVLE